MINAIILSNNFNEKSIELYQKISSFCPTLNLLEVSCGKQTYIKSIKEYSPQLVFFNIKDGLSDYQELFQNFNNHSFETILVSSTRDHVFEAIKYKISGYLLKPINEEALKSTVNFAIKRIENEKKRPLENGAIFNCGVLGIPTMEGYEFLTIEDIIRCESYYKCTRVITKERCDIISSYNIGQFLKYLNAVGFFSPHQSHLINLNQVKKFLKEGTIIMKDNATIPVSRRRRNDFLNQIPHI